MVLGWKKMDPQSLAFTPQNNDLYRLSSAMRNFEETQQEHADRLSRLERQRDEDVRVKSVWGPTSPFPGILSGTPQHGPIRHPTVDFANFDDDDQSNAMVRSLHLDADDEPRRYGVGSRANSVRFDDSAKPGQWGHASRSSVDLPSRAGSSFGHVGGGHPMFERTVSHKSDGRNSIASRANSLMLDSSSQPYTPAAEEPPSLAPGLQILGSVPSIIRCWLTENFKHDTLLYAAICTGSYKSYLDSRMVEHLGLTREVCQDLSGDKKIKLLMYLPEAVPMPVSSRSSTSDHSQLPSITVDFTIIERSTRHDSSKAIQIFIGSDALRAHNTDILFSSNVLTLFDDDRQKHSIPLVRPENDETFKGLFTTSATPTTSRFRPGLALDTKSETFGMSNGNNNLTLPKTQPFRPTQIITPEPAAPLAAGEVQKHEQPEEQVQTTTDVYVIPKIQEEPKQETALFEPRKSTETQEPSNDPNIPASSSSRSASSSAVWGNWRRDPASTPQPSTPSEWSNRNGSVSIARPTRDQGIKVLKPARTVSRNAASPLPASPMGSIGQPQSRFFDDGKRRDVSSLTLDAATRPPPRRSTSGESAKGMALGRPEARDMKETTTPLLPTPKPRGTNPIGGASAFAWLNSSGK